MQHRVEHGIATQRRSGLRARPDMSVLDAATLDHEDGLLARHALGDSHEPLRIAERLHVEHDRGRALVIRAPLEQIAGRDVGAVPKRNEDRHPKPSGCCMSEQPQSQPNGVRADRQTPPLDAHTPERRVEADVGSGVECPQRSRADHPQPRAAHDLEQPSFLLSRCHPVVLGPGRKHEERLRSARRRLGGISEQVVAARGNDHQLRSDRQLVETARSAHRTHHPAISMNRDATP